MINPLAHDLTNTHIRIVLTQLNNVTYIFIQKSFSLLRFILFSFEPKLSKQKRPPANLYEFNTIRLHHKAFVTVTWCKEMDICSQRNKASMGVLICADEPKHCSVQPKAHSSICMQLHLNSYLSAAT